MDAWFNAITLPMSLMVSPNPLAARWCRAITVPSVTAISRWPVPKRWLIITWAAASRRCGFRSGSPGTGRPGSRGARRRTWPCTWFSPRGCVCRVHLGRRQSTRRSSAPIRRWSHQARSDTTLGGGVVVFLHHALALFRTRRTRCYLDP